MKSLLLSVLARCGLSATLVIVAGAALAQDGRPFKPARVPWSAPAVPAAPRTAIVTPPYGDALFAYYQGRVFETVTRLMVSQHFARLGASDDDAEIVRAGLLLSLGLLRESAQAFERLAERGASLAVRDRAWFYLAKIRYQRGLPPEDAEAALARIGGPLPPDLDEERGLLAGTLLMQRGDFSGAARALSALERRGHAGAFARYNLGIALVRAGDVARGRAVLDALGRANADTEEAWTLRDKANVAHGYASLQADDPASARVSLQRVRLASLQSSQALLGFGWAAASLGQMQPALVPWSELESRMPVDSAVLEAKLAVPYAYAQLGATGQAAVRYDEAMSFYAQEQARLDESIAAIRAGRLFEGLLERNPGGRSWDEMGWFWRIDKLPALPHDGHLNLVLARHEFQEAFKNYRDLLFLSRNVAQRRAELPAVRDMLAHRREIFESRLPGVAARATEIESQLDATAARAPKDALYDALTRATDSADGVAFANPIEQAQLERIARAQRDVDALAPAEVEGQIATAERALAHDRVRRLAGELRWQLARDYPIRVWEARKGMRQYETGLDESQRRRAALAAAIRDEPVRFERWSARIDTVDRELAQALPQLDRLIAEQRAVVQELAVAELLRQRDRLDDFSAQARFALAQLIDREESKRIDGARVPGANDNAGGDRGTR